MRLKLECKICGATCWASGDYEPDTNATNVGDLLTEWEGSNRGYDACNHSDYWIIDSEEEAYD